MGNRFLSHHKINSFSHLKVKKLGEKLPDAPKEDVIPEVGELDELETFVGSKKTKFGYGQQ